MRVRATLALSAVAAALAACDPSSTVAVSPVVGRVAATPSASLVPLDPFGIAAKVPGSHGCSASPYHDFDFWVGAWDVFNPGGGLAGTNVVKSRLDGCAVEENWTGAFGGRGRSLNFYDASTGKWSQMWVDSSGCPFGVITIEGGLENGSMTMHGRREQPEGFLAGPPCSAAPTIVAFARNDLIRWTPLASGSVLQQLSASNNDDPIPPLAPPSSGNGLRYDRVATVTPLTPAQPSFCPGRAAARQFDFLIGEWDVHQGNAKGAQGRALFAKDLQGCLVEEQLKGPGGYEGLSFNTFDVFSQRWLRTYVDNDGQRIYMTGGFENGRMVLIGTKLGSAGSVAVRVAWVPESTERVLQRWDYSRDGGVTWQAGQDIVFTKRH